MGSKRILWIDYLKAISMLLVVVYHTPERYNVLDEGVVFNLGVPIFFVLAGFLYNPAKHAGTGQYLLHRARQLLIPYATFFVVFYALWLAVGRRMVGPEEEAIAWWTPLYEFATGQPTVVLGAFWYIACLFSMQVVYHVLQRWIPGKWMIAASVVLALSTYALYIHPWNVGKAFIYMPLYAVGHTCREALAAIARQPARLRLATAVPLVAGIAVLAWSATVADRLLFRYATVAGVLLVLPAWFAAAPWIASRFGERKMVTHIAVYGITYLALQNYLIGIIKLVLCRLCGPDVFTQQWWLKAVVALTVMLLIYPCSLFIARWMPWMLGKSRTATPKEKSISLS